MKTLEEIISSYSDQDLEESFNEIVEWRNAGVLKVDGYVRKAKSIYLDETGRDFPINSIENHFLFEMAKRKYSN